MTIDLRALRTRLPRESGYTLLELVITLVVLSILIMGTIPLAQNAAKRQKEIRLRETLRSIRNAIDEFKRDSVGACPAGSGTSVQLGQAGPFTMSDPRSRVVIDDCTIFDSQNLDRYPPSLDALVDGVKVRQRGLGVGGGGGLGGSPRQATDILAAETEEIKKVYLREMPIDPMTGKSDWLLRSSYEDPDSSWDSINVFDVRSSSDETALNGEKYSDW
jgi:general secretion pathway protein G